MSNSIKAKNNDKIYISRYNKIYIDWKLLYDMISTRLNLTLLEIYDFTYWMMKDTVVIIYIAICKNDTK